MSRAKADDLKRIFETDSDVDSAVDGVVVPCNRLRLIQLPRFTEVSPGNNRPNFLKVGWINELQIRFFGRGRRVLKIAESILHAFEDLASVGVGVKGFVTAQISGESADHFSSNFVPETKRKL